MSSVRTSSPVASTMATFVAVEPMSTPMPRRPDGTFFSPTAMLPYSVSMNAAIRVSSWPMSPAE